MIGRLIEGSRMDLNCNIDLAIGIDLLEQTMLA
jgi:hypothetical protein